MRPTVRQHMMQHIRLREVFWLFFGFLELLDPLVHVRVRLLHTVLDLVEHLALRLDEHRHVHEQLVQFDNALLEAHDVPVLILDVRQRVLRRLGRAVGEQLLREDGIRAPVFEDLVDLLGRRVRLHHLELAPHPVSILVLVLCLHILILLHQRDELLGQSALQILSDPRLTIPAPPRLLRVLLALGVHLLERLLHGGDQRRSLVHHVLQLLLAFVACGGGDGGERGAVLLLDVAHVLFDLRHVSSHLRDLIEERSHEGALPNSAAALLEVQRDVIWFCVVGPPEQNHFQRIVVNLPPKPHWYPVHPR
mmetsp:Transcript_39109/g.89120  ORF Transcript_39109/g.89120 Transcript_39109/m.89120 type:complete len:307 (-) Transcript_39109:121-1041(-)